MEVSMNDFTVRRLEMANRVVGFLDMNPFAFRSGSPGPELMNQFKQAVMEIRNLTQAQVSELEVSRSRSAMRGNARTALCETLNQITRTSRGMVVRIPEIEGKFQPVHGLGDSRLHTHARSFEENAKTFQMDFVNFGMAPDFIDDLHSRILALEQAVVQHATGRSAHVTTAQLIDNAMQKAMNILVQLDPVVENYLRSDAARTFKWQHARRTERAWVSRKPTKTKGGKETKSEADPSAAAA
jgi:hypothetical protein